MSKLFHSYGPEKQQEVRERLYKFQNGKCFLCDEPLDLSNVKSMHLDHKKAQAEKGPDDESNWVLLCSNCNLKKSDMPLQLAKNRLQFERDKRKYGESFTLGKVFDIMRNGAEGKPLFMRKQDGNMIELEFIDGTGAQVKQQLHVCDDAVTTGTKSVFVELPISHLFHDGDLNPRAISEKDVNLIDEFYYRNPQLHFCLGRVEEIEKLEGSTKIKAWVFDGQHKAAARLYNGWRTLPVRLFVEYDYELLKQTNFRAHTDLVQMEFFKSITSEVGSGMFADAFKKYLEKHSRENVSENTFLQSIELPRDRSEMGGHFKQWLKYNILHPEKNNPSRHNKMTPFIEGEKTRERQKPISYDSFEKSLMRHFVYMYPSDELIAPGGSEHSTSYLRFEERDNLIKLMKMISDKVLIDKFDTTKGADKLENRLSKGEKFPDDHVKAYRIFRPRVLEVWCEVLKEVVKTSLKIKGKLSEKNAHDGKIFWCKLSDDDWEQVDAMLNKIFNHKVWETKDREMIEAIGTTKKDIAQAFITEGKIGDKKALEPPINTQYLLS